MELINFCHSNLQSTVSCNTCCSESYEETNLLSPDPSKLRRGFMADRFIKPPIEIEVTFKYPISLSHILIWPQVGQQKSSGIAIHSTYTGAIRTHERNAHEKSTSKLKSSSREEISCCYLSENDHGFLFFCPRKFVKWAEINKFQNPAGFIQKPFTWSQISAITNIKSLTIRIVKTNGSSVPALGKIEIWGQPGYFTTKCEKKELSLLWKRRDCDTKLLDCTGPVCRNPSAKPGTSKEQASNETPTEVPEDFLDALTYEIMAVPMVLPCGKVVDQRTLEKHQEAEANWGRPPTDPFTGRPFSSTLHPVLDSALKSRIERFLVIHQNREDIRYIPRTVGRKQPVSLNIHSKSTSNNLTPNTQFCLKSLEIVQTDDSQKSCDSPANNTVAPLRKRERSPEVVILSESPMLKRPCSLPKTSLGTLANTSINNCTDDDLDDALKSVLSGLPSYVNNPTLTIPPDQCKCKNKENLFKLPCEHLICRMCLLQKTKSNQLSCCECKSKFTSSQPVRYHF